MLEENVQKEFLRLSDVVEKYGISHRNTEGWEETVDVVSKSIGEGIKVFMGHLVLVHQPRYIKKCRVLLTALEAYQKDFQKIVKGGSSNSVLRQVNLSARLEEEASEEANSNHATADVTIMSLI